MVSVEQTHPANQVNNAHGAHPSIFTCFDLTFNARDSFSQRAGRGKQHRVESTISLGFFSSKQVFFFFFTFGPKVLHLTFLFYFPVSLRRNDAGERNGEIFHGEEQPPV